METRVCKACKEELNVSVFRKSKTNKGGYSPRCRKCNNIIRREHYLLNQKEMYQRHKKYNETNKEKVDKYRKQYRINNKEILLVKQKEYIIKNKKQRLEYNKKYRIENKEIIAVKIKIYNENNKFVLKEKRKKYNEINKVKISNYWKIYRIKNKTYLEDMAKKYQEKNKIKLTEYQKKYFTTHKFNFYKNLKLRNERFKMLPATLTREQWKEIKNTFKNKCCYCNKDLPLAQEHFVALTKGGEFTHNNIIPSCKSCNSSKGTKDFFEWYPKFKHYSKQREKAILKFLNYKNGIQQLKII